MQLIGEIKLCQKNEDLMIKRKKLGEEIK